MNDENNNWTPIDSIRFRMLIIAWFLSALVGFQCFPTPRKIDEKQIQAIIEAIKNTQDKTNTMDTESIKNANQK